GRSSRVSLEDTPAPDHRHVDRRRQQLARRERKQVLLEHDQVRELARLERALLVLLPLRVGRAPRVGVERLLEAELLLGKEPAGWPAAGQLARDRRVQAEAQIERLDEPVGPEGHWNPRA